MPVIKITTEILRKYLVEYQTINNCGKVTIDNIRRSLSTFFSLLEEEEYIIKSPMKRIHKVKTAVVVKETIPDEKVDRSGNTWFMEKEIKREKRILRLRRKFIC